MAWNLHAIEQAQNRVDGVGRPKLHFHTGRDLVHLLLIYLSARSSLRAVSIISAAAWMRPAFLRSRAFFSGKSTAVGVCSIALSITLMASSSCPSHSRQWAWRYNAQASLVGVVLSPFAKVFFDESAAACVFAMSRTFRQHCEPRHRPSTTSPGEGAHNLSSVLPKAGAPLFINRRQNASS